MRKSVFIIAETFGYVYFSKMDVSKNCIKALQKATDKLVAKREFFAMAPNKSIYAWVKNYKPHDYELVDDDIEHVARNLARKGENFNCEVITFDDIRFQIYLRYVFAIDLCREGIGKPTIDWEQPLVEVYRELLIFKWRSHALKWLSDQRGAKSVNNARTLLAHLNELHREGIRSVWVEAP